MDIQALPPSVALDKNLADLQSRLSDSYPTASTDFLALSNPRCVFKTGTAWPVRTGPQAQRLLREALPVCDHPMQDRWLEIGQLISEHLDSCGVEWSSIDPVRFAEAKKPAVSELYLWIGVLPQSLVFDAAKAAAEGCKDILAREGFPDVEIAFRESVVKPSGGPKLLPFSPSIDPVAELRSPFTATLGIQIALLETPSCEGTGAVYLRESSQSDRVFLLTAAHVARPPPAHPNRLILCKQQSQTSQEIVVLGTSAYTNAINHMTDTIDRELLSIQTWEDEIKRWGPVVEGEPRDKTHAREDFKNLVKKSRRRIEATNELHDEVVTEHWTTPNQRVIGYVVYAPTVGVDEDAKHFTRDWALIDLYRDKIDWNTFQGNKVYVDLSSRFYLEDAPPPIQLQVLLQVTGVLKDEEIRHPQQLDANSERCLIVVKNGKATGTTLGRLSGMESFVRMHVDNGSKETSIEVAVYPYMLDSEGRIVGLLIAGAGANEDTDVTYITPYWWIEEQIRKEFPQSFLYEIVD
ncbi:hypothetical protein CPB85DRAFT_1255447 [Mucidula mucida]|nr:hypothetical protein CPB85DRAFT_1255447 [Mucidula mucida]